MCAQSQHQDGCTQWEAEKSSLQGWEQPSPTGKAFKFNFHFSWPKSSCRGLANSSHAGCHPPLHCRNGGSMPEVPPCTACPRARKASSASPRAGTSLRYRSKLGLQVLCPRRDRVCPRVPGMSPPDTGSHTGQQHATGKVPSPLAAQRMPIFQVGV